MKKLFLSIFVAFLALVTLAACGGDKATLDSIELDTSSVKVEYYLGESLDTTGLKVTAKFSNDTTKDIALGECQIDTSAYKKDVVGEYEIKVTYSEKVASYKVSVIKKVIPLSTIESVLTSASNNQEIKVQGVVFAIIENKIFIADGQKGVISIIKTAAVTTEVALGDKVEVVGEYGTSSKEKNVKNVKELTVLESGVACPHVAEEKPIAEVNGLKVSEAYGHLVTVVGSVEELSAGTYCIRDDNNKTLYFSENSNAEALATAAGKRVKLTVLLNVYDSIASNWTVTYLGTAEEIIDSPLTIEEIKALVIADLEGQVVSEATGYLALPSSERTGVEYTWSTEGNPNITITDNKATVALAEEDSVATVKLLVTYAEQSFELSFEVTLKAVVYTALSEIIANEPSQDKCIVKTKGVIVAFSRMQGVTSSSAARSIFIKDLETNAFMRVDFGTKSTYPITGEVFTSLKEGDVIELTGSYRTSVAASARIQDVSSLKVVDHIENALDLSAATVLETEEQYNAFFAEENADKVYNSFIKLVNPYMSYSVSALSKLVETSWVRFGASAGAVNTSAYLGKNLAVLIALGNENLGGTAWHELLNITTTEEEAVQHGVEIYAFIYSTSDSYVTLCIPSNDCFIASPEVEIEIDLINCVPASAEDGHVISLVKEHAAAPAGVVWTSSHPELVNVETGLVTGGNETTDVTLTAKYSINDVEYTKEYVVTVLKSVPLTVSQVLASADNEAQVKVSGVVIGHGSDGNSYAYRYSLLVMDPETQEVIQVNNLPDGKYGAYLDSTGATIKVGDVVTIKGTYLLDTIAIGNGPVQTGRKNIEVSEITVTGTHTIAYDDSKVITVTSEAELAAVVADGVTFGQIIKLSGSFYIRGSKKTPTEWAETNVLFAMKDTKPASLNDMKYACGAKSYAFALKYDNIAPLYGENWVSSILGYNEILTANDYILVSGTLYISITHHTGSYYQCTLLNIENCSAAPVVE